MTDTTTAALLSSLNDDSYDVEDSAVDVRYRTVVDCNGEENPGLCRHYGYDPFWAPGYVYPAYPLCV